MQFSNLNNQHNDPGDSEITLLSILRFLKDAYKTILVAGVLGLGASIVYLVASPKRYEAVAQISMAQIDSFNNKSGFLNPMGVNVEEPFVLITRLAQPTSFTLEVLSSCGLANVANSGAIFVKSMKLTKLKGVENIVELRVYGASAQDAKYCAQAIFDFIKVTQAQIIAPYIEEAKARLNDDETRLEKSKNFIAQADKSGQAMGAAYLSTRDEIRFLLEEMAVLKSLITSNDTRTTRLIAPIYASDIPITPSKRLVLAVGLLGGLLFGSLLVLVRHMIAVLKSELGGSK